MADTVDTGASSSPVDGAEQPQDATRADQAEQPQDAAPAGQAEQPHDATPAGQAEQPQDATPAGQAEQPQDARSDLPEDKAERREEEAEEPEDARSVTELFEQLGRELSELGMAEAQLEAARNMPEVRRLARDIVGALVAVVATLTAFAFVNVAAVDGLSRVLATWLAALVLAAVWIAVGGVLLFGLMGRARRWLLWIVGKAPPTKALEELEGERDAAGRDARSTLERLGPALAIQIALAAVPKASEVAGDVASGVVEAGDSVLDASDEIIGEFTEQIPGGGAVNQVWAVALTPGRLGIRVATTVLRRGRPAD
jgi:Putative Actinobacterial Holin-X, holin superfamily III